MQGDNHYFENAGGKSFVDKTAEFFPNTPWGSMGIKFFDYDNDGLLDLLRDRHALGHERGDRPRAREAEVAHALAGGLPAGRRPTTSSATRSTSNLGGGRFEEVSDRMGAENYWPWGVSVGDINADGWDDVFITSGMGFPFRYGINTMLLNDRGAEVRGRRVPARASSRGRAAARTRTGSTWTARPRARSSARSAGGPDGQDHA